MLNGTEKVNRNGQVYRLIKGVIERVVTIVVTFCVWGEPYQIQTNCNNSWEESQLIAFDRIYNLPIIPEFKAENTDTKKESEMSQISVNKINSP
jgi:hypothetical protein